jgi:hypothetical protein
MAVFVDSKPRSSEIELRLGSSQIKIFSLYFIYFGETINVFQLISQGCSKIQIFQKKISLEALEATGSGSNLGFNYSYFEKQDNPRKTSIQLLLKAQQHKKYAQTAPLDDGVSSLF